MDAEPRSGPTRDGDRAALDPVVMVRVPLPDRCSLQFLLGLLGGIQVPLAVDAFQHIGTPIHESNVPAG